MKKSIFLPQRFSVFALRAHAQVNIESGLKRKLWLSSHVRHVPQVFGQLRRGRPLCSPHLVSCFLRTHWQSLPSLFRKRYDVLSEHSLSSATTACCYRECQKQRMSEKDEARAIVITTVFVLTTTVYSRIRTRKVEEEESTRNSSKICFLRTRAYNNIIIFNRRNYDIYVDSIEAFFILCLRCVVF
jgi:hypothetical protein